MIELKCVKCAAVLQLDDAFAGGTCRCSACGAIQTVPSSAPRKPGRPQPQPRPMATAVPQDVAVPTSGLDDLADAVNRTPAAPGPSKSELAASRDASVRRSKFAISIVAAVVAIAGGVWVATRRPAAAPADATNEPAPPAAKVPSIGPLPLSGPVVAYVVDRGDASQDVYPQLKTLLARSAATLGPGRKFVVVLWPNGEPDPMPAAPADATAENVRAMVDTLEPTIATGRSDAAAAMKTALDLRADELVVITAKGWQLDETFVNGVLQARGGRPTKVNVLSLGSSGPLADLARATGGRFLELTPDLLRDATK